MNTNDIIFLAFFYIYLSGMLENQSKYQLNKNAKKCKV